MRKGSQTLVQGEAGAGGGGGCTKSPRHGSPLPHIPHPCPFPRAPPPMCPQNERREHLPVDIRGPGVALGPRITDESSGGGGPQRPCDALHSPTDHKNRMAARRGGTGPRTAPHPNSCRLRGVPCTVFQCKSPFRQKRRWGVGVLVCCRPQWEGRDVLEGGEGGGVGWLGPPPSQGPPVVPAEGGSKSLNPFGAEGAEANCWLSASNIGRGGRGDGGPGGGGTGRSNTSLGGGGGRLLVCSRSTNGQ